MTSMMLKTAGRGVAAAAAVLGLTALGAVPASAEEFDAPGAVMTMTVTDTDSDGVADSTWWVATTAKDTREPIRFTMASGPVTEAGGSHSFDISTATGEFAWEDMVVGTIKASQLEDASDLPAPMDSGVDAEGRPDFINDVTDLTDDLDAVGAETQSRELGSFDLNDPDGSADDVWLIAVPMAISDASKGASIGVGEQRTSGLSDAALEVSAKDLGAVAPKASQKVPTESGEAGSAETVTPTATADSGDQEDSATSQTAHEPGEGMAYTGLPEVISPEMLERGFRLEVSGLDSGAELSAPFSTDGVELSDLSGEADDQGIAQVIVRAATEDGPVAEGTDFSLDLVSGDQTQTVRFSTTAATGDAESGGDVTGEAFVGDPEESASPVPIILGALSVGLVGLALAAIAMARYRSKKVLTVAKGNAKVNGTR